MTPGHSGVRCDGDLFGGRRLGAARRSRNWSSLRHFAFDDRAKTLGCVRDCDIHVHVFYPHMDITRRTQRRDRIAARWQAQPLTNTDRETHAHQPNAGAKPGQRR